MAWLYQPLPLASSVTAGADADEALDAAATFATAEAGSCGVDHSQALSGQASTCSSGAFNVEILATNLITSAAGSTTSANNSVRLRSRKTGGASGTASQELSGTTFVASAQTITRTVSVLLGGSGIPMAQQSLGKTNSHLLNGIQRTMFTGTVSDGTTSGFLPTWTQIPTQVDEENYYNTNFGPGSGKEEVWIWTPSDKTVSFTLPPTNLLRISHTMHNDTEGDDLWSHYMQYKRVTDATPRNIHDQWGTAWRNFFVDEYVPSVIAQGDDADVYPIGDCNNYDHLYGWGALMWAMEKNDLSARSAVLSLANQVEAQMYASLVPGVNSASLSGARRYSRRLMFYTYVALMDPIPRWIAARDFMIDFWLQSPGWQDSTNSAILPGQGGHHFMGRSSFGTTTEGAAGGLGVDQYDQGYRVSNGIYYATSCMAIWAAYKATGRADLRDMMIQMARFVLNYAWDPLHVNPMTGSYWGVEPDGTPWHQHQDDFTHNAGNPTASDPLRVPNTATGPPNTPWTDPNSSSADNYEITIVNTLVYGYKLTGEFAFLKRAREHFRKATQYTAIVGKGNPASASNIVLAFVDTKRDSDQDYFTNGKGMLQNCSAIFENGGSPEVENPGPEVFVPPYPVPTAPGEVIPIGGFVITSPTEITNSGTTYGQTVWPTNTWAQVWPPEIPSSTALMGNDSACTVLPNYSLGGAVGTAGGGGHGGPTMHGGAVFDFMDGAWKRHWTGGMTNVSEANDWTDLVTGTRVHNCLASTPQFLEGYNLNCGWLTTPCQNPAHWVPNAAQSSTCPLTPDPDDQTWEISQIHNSANPATHQYPIPANWGGLGIHSITGYVNASTRNPAPSLPGTLEPTQSGLPAPSHTWDFMFELAPDDGGGPKGSIVCSRHNNMGGRGLVNMDWSHRFDLDTGIWHQFSTNSSAGTDGAAPGAGPWRLFRAVSGAYDPVGKRMFMVGINQFSISGGERVNYANVTDRTWRNVNFGSSTGVVGAPNTENLMVDHDRRLLVMVGSASTGASPGPRIWVANLASVTGHADPDAILVSGTGGWKNVLGSQVWPITNPFSGGFVSNSEIPFVYYPPNGKYYRFIAQIPGGNPSGSRPDGMTVAQYYADPIATTSNLLQRISPPPIDAAAHAADPSYYVNSANWTIDEITLGMRMARPSLGGQYCAVGQKWLKYIPALQLLAWLPLNNMGTDPPGRRPVYLIKPF